jgi:hypothetical protein
MNTTPDPLANIVIGFVRTIVPGIVAALADWLAHVHLNLDANGLNGLEAFLVTLFTALYYLAVRVFETYVSPKFGWLLGYAKQPVYRRAIVESVTRMQAPNPATAK